MKFAVRYSITELPTVIYAIDQRQYEKLIQYPSFSKSLLQSSCIKNEVLRRREESLAFDTGKERLFKLLQSLANTNILIDACWHPLSIHYTHAEMSSIIGVNRVTISRFMSELAEEGKIRSVNRRIQVHKESSNT